MDINLLTKIHFGIAALTLLLFIIRGVMMVANSPKTHSVMICSINVIITTSLIFLGLYLAYAKQLSFSDGFTISKLTYLVLFLVLGGIALKQGLPKIVAIVLWLLAFAAFCTAAMTGMHMIPALF